MSLSIRAGLEDLGRIRHFFVETACSLGLSESLANDLRLAVDEAVTNIIVHGYNRGTGDIEIDITTRGRDLVVYLRDQAEAFDPTTFSESDLKSPLQRNAPGGYGLHLMRKLMDEIHHKAMNKGGNELTLVKHNALSNDQDPHLISPS